MSKHRTTELNLTTLVRGWFLLVNHWLDLFRLCLWNDPLLNQWVDLFRLCLRNDPLLNQWVDLFRLCLRNDPLLNQWVDLFRLWLWDDPSLNQRVDLFRLCLWDDPPKLVRDACVELVAGLGQPLSEVALGHTLLNLLQSRVASLDLVCGQLPWKEGRKRFI